jgi:catechol 2,3-dioxygenase-like lactoylglutathione lyase family enzyme
MTHTMNEASTAANLAKESPGHAIPAIEGIDAITYSTDGTAKNWDDARRFFADWGLTLRLDDATQQVWETQNGAQVIVKRPDDAHLAPAFEAGPTLREVVWGVNNYKYLENIKNLASKSRINFDISYDKSDILKINYISISDPHGLTIRFQCSQKRPVSIQGAATNPFGNPQRIDAASPVYERATPVEIGHVVLFSNCLDEAEAFYQQLGFVTSDRYPGRGVFMRCAQEGGHHDLFLLALPGKPSGLNHVAFTVRDIHEVFGGGLHMSRCGWKTQLGPGRHPISSAYFWYFENPCGGLIEYNADEDHLTAKWQAREFTPGPTVFAEWAVDGGLDGHTRRQPQVQASGAFLTEKKP